MKNGLLFLILPLLTSCQSEGAGGNDTAMLWTAVVALALLLIICVVLLVRERRKKKREREWEERALELLTKQVELNQLTRYANRLEATIAREFRELRPCYHEEHGSAHGEKEEQELTLAYYREQIKRLTAETGRLSLLTERKDRTPAPEWLAMMTAAMTREKFLEEEVKQLITYILKRLHFNNPPERISGNPKRNMEVYQAWENERWKELATAMRRIFPDFMKNIEKLFASLPEITLRICMMTKLHMSNKEIGDMLNLSIKSIQKYKTDMRQELKKQNVQTFSDSPTMDAWLVRF